MITEVETELGKAEVSVVKVKDANKEFKCPCCDTTVEIGEQHYVVVPEVDHYLRRHCHTDCVEQHVAHGLRIVLHPNERNIERYRF